MALRAVGLVLVYYASWMMPVAFAGICGVLLTSLISPSIKEYVPAHAGLHNIIRLIYFLLYTAT